MKILMMEKTWFELPDDADGSISNALRSMADYIDTPTKSMGPGSKTNEFKDFLEARKQGGKLVSNGCSVQFLNQETNKWEKQPQKLIFIEDTIRLTKK